jgi:hypothetical protein
MGKVKIYNHSIVINEDGANVSEYIDTLQLDQKGLDELINKKVKEYLGDEGFCVVEYEGDNYCVIGMATDTEIDHLQDRLDTQQPIIDSVEQYADIKGV